MRHRFTLPFLAALCGTALSATSALAFQDEDRIVYADSPKDRYEARLLLLENDAEARKAQCRGSGIGGKSYCTQEIEKMLRTKKRELKAKYEAEIAGTKGAQ